MRAREIELEIEEELAEVAYFTFAGGIDEEEARELDEEWAAREEQRARETGCPHEWLLFEPFQVDPFPFASWKWDDLLFFRWICRLCGKRHLAETGENGDPLDRGHRRRVVVETDR